MDNAKKLSPIFQASVRLANTRWLQSAEKSGFGTGPTKGRRFCDPWWENETEWHRAWKDQFPADWQEIVHHAEDGEKHIADVKTDRWLGN